MRPPITVLVYIAKWTAIVVVTLAVTDDRLVAIAAFLALAIALTGLWRGSRIAWVALLALEMFAFASPVVLDARWWVAPLSVVAFGLLVARPTREHVGAA